MLIYSWTRQVYILNSSLFVVNLCGFAFSDVRAAYARFLWETEDDEDEDEGSDNHNGVPCFHGAVAATNA